MYVSIYTAVTFNGNSNVMHSNMAPSSKGKGKSIDSLSNNLTFSVCHPGDTITPATYTTSVSIDIDLEKCCTTIANKATAATVTCTSTTNSRLEGNCTTGHWKNTTRTADVCTPHTVCGNQLSGSATRLIGASLTAAGTCNPCAIGTFAKDNTTNCVNSCGSTEVANSNKAETDSINGTFTLRKNLNVCCHLF